MKKTKLSFMYPVRKQVTRNVNGIIKKEYDLVSLLEVEGTAYFHPNEPELSDRFTFEIDSIQKQGVNILPELELFGSIHDIEEAALKETMNLFRADSIADGEVGRTKPEPPVNGRNEFSGPAMVLKIFEPLNKILDDHAGKLADERFRKWEDTNSRIVDRFLYD